MMLATDLAVLDHTDGSLLLVANAVNYDGTDERVDEAWADAVARLDRMTAELAAPAPSTVAVHGGPPSAPARQRTEREEYLAAVVEGKEAIRDGEVFQVVISQRFEWTARRTPSTSTGCCAPRTRARTCTCLRAATRTGEPFDVVGSSPEALVKVDAGRVITHPIAGHAAARRHPGGGRRAGRGAARRREGAGGAPHARRPGPQRPRPGLRARHRRGGRVHGASSGTATSCTSSPRWRAICAPADVAFDVLRRDVPGGHPLRRAEAAGHGDHRRARARPARRLRRRRRLLRLRRRPRHGHRDPHGADRATGIAHVQAGAGIVADSDPEREYEECRNKAAAVLRAVATASTLRAP